MSFISAIANLEAPISEQKSIPSNHFSIDRFDVAMETLDFISMLNTENIDLLNLIMVVRMDSSAIEHLNTTADYKGILDIISSGDVERLNKRLKISNEDLFNRTNAGIRDVYVSSLTEDVTNFIGNLWNAIKSSLQKTYAWSTNLGSENSTVDLCKKSIEAINQNFNTSGNASVACDMIDPEDWMAKADECSKLLAALTALITGASQSVITGQLNEKSLQDQLLGMMQRANIEQIKLVIESGPSSSSFRFPGINSSRIELKDTKESVLTYGQKYTELLTNLDNMNKSIVGYAQAIVAAQTQYKCNTDCAAVVSNIGSATQMITKAVVAADSYILGSISVGLLDITKKISDSLNTLPSNQTNTPEANAQ